MLEWVQDSEEDGGGWNLYRSHTDDLASDRLATVWRIASDAHEWGLWCEFCGITDAGFAIPEDAMARAEELLWELANEVASHGPIPRNGIAK